MTGGGLRIFLVAGEHSGDVLGGRLMGGLRSKSVVPLVLAGVGGEAMASEGLASLFPLGDVAVMGPVQILKRLPSIVRRVYQTVDAAVAFDPDVVVIIDSPEFTHPIAKRIRRRRPGIPIIDYVSPSIWAWRPGRARKMSRYVDHVLALLPFEPEAHRKLGGPACTYVGHSLVEELGWIDGVDGVALGHKLGIEDGRPVVVVLPGSRRSEVDKLAGVFGQALGLVRERWGVFDVIVPTVGSVRELVERRVADWPVDAQLVDGRRDMFAAFRRARAALAASGTVTLELAAAGVPMVVGYKVDAAAAPIFRRLITAPSAVLPNLILGDNVFVEFMQEDCSAEKLAQALIALLGDTPAREKQIQGLGRVRQALCDVDGQPSEAAAEIVLGYAARGRDGSVG